MGWLSGWNSRKEIAAHCLATQENETTRWEMIAHCFVGNNLWTVMQITNKADSTVAKLIVLFLLQRFEGGTWGYKDVSEDMGPNEVSCPLKYLEMAPLTETGGFAFEWRERVKAHWKHRHDASRFAASLKPGDKFKAFGVEFIFLAFRKNLVLGPKTDAPAGQVYRIQRCKIEPVAATEPATVSAL